MPTYPATGDVALHYRDRGSGEPPIVFVHGWQANGEIWQPVIDRLATSHRTIALDLRGAGANAAAAGPYTVAQFADDLATLTRALNAGRVVVVGHSMGGVIAQRFAIDHPAAVAGMVLLAPVPASGLALSSRAQEVFRAVPSDARALRNWLGMLTAKPLAPERFDLLVRAGSTIARHAALESFESWSRADFEDEARTIDVPTLVIAGAADRPQTPELLREKVVEVIAGSRMVVVAEAGHYVQLEQDERVAFTIDAFVRELRERSPL